MKLLKLIRLFLFTLVLVAAALPALAQDAAVDSTSSLQPILDLLKGKYGKLSEIIIWCTAIGAALKFFNARIQRFLTGCLARGAANPADDQYMLALLATKPYRFIAFLLDLTIRLKLPSLEEYQKLIAARNIEQVKQSSSPAPGGSLTGILSAMAVIAIPWIAGSMMVMMLLLSAGCGTPNQTAYKATSVVVTTVNQAVQTWWDAKKAGLVKPEADAKVKDAYEKYQLAMKAEADAYTAYLAAPANTTDLQRTQAVASSVEADLLNLIIQLLPPDKAAALKGVK